MYLRDGQFVVANIAVYPSIPIKIRNIPVIVEMDGVWWSNDD